MRYDQVNAMLLNEFLKAHRRLEEQQMQISQLNSRVATQEAVIAQQQQKLQATTARQQDEIRALTTTLKEQAAEIQKVSVEMEIRRSGSHVVKTP